jgi:KDO2-lipid IV(A) lauroyltransferase
MRAADGNLASGEEARQGRKTSAAVRTRFYRYALMPACYAVFKLLQGLFRVLPPGVCYGLGRAVALVLWCLNPRRRRLALRNLEIALGHKYSQPELRRIARLSSQHFVLTLMDLLLVPQYYRDGRWRKIIEVTPAQEAFFDAVARQGRPVAFHTAHFGSWEVAHGLCGLLGHGLALIYRPLDFPQLEAEVRKIRGCFGNDIYPKDGALKGYLKTLRRKGWVGVIADQNAGRAGAFVSFFGIPVATELRHYLLFQRFPETRLICGFVRRDGFRFRFRILGPYEIDMRPGGDEMAEAMRLAQWYTDCLQRAVEETPEQFEWIHRRFRTRPPGAPSLYANLGQPLDRDLLRQQPHLPLTPPARHQPAADKPLADRQAGQDAEE